MPTNDDQNPTPKTRGDSGPITTAAFASEKAEASPLPSHPEICDAIAQQRFERMEFLGRGGFGSVFSAYDRQLQRLIAMKVPHEPVDQATGDHQRLRREATATARLRHPNIVPLYDCLIGPSGAVLISELIQGETLDKWLARHPQGCTESSAASIVMHVALAVQHAHDQSVLHRDIKPSNILLDPSSPVDSLGFRPRLSDFGVAKIIRQDSVGESQGDFVGTYQYSPPEVLGSSLRTYTRLGDVYMLGIVLFELLTGQLPFQAAKLEELFPKISQGDYITPKKLRTGLSSDLEAICLCAMARRPQDRYASAADLAADLERFLEGRPIKARPPGRVEKIARWIRLHPTATAVLVISGVAAGILLGVSTVKNRQLSQLNSQLSTMNDRLEQTNADLAGALQASTDLLFEYEQAAYAEDMAFAHEAIERNRPRDAAALLSRYTDANQSLAHHRDTAWYHAAGRVLRDSDLLWQGTDALYALAVCGDHGYVVGGAASVLTLLDRDSGEVTRQQATGQTEINVVVYDNQQKQVWCGGEDGTLHAYTLPDFQFVKKNKIFADQYISQIVPFFEQRRLVCLGSRGTVVCVDAESVEISQTLSDFLPEDRKATAATCIGPLGDSEIAIGYYDGRLVGMRIRDGQETMRLQLDEPHDIRWLTLDTLRQRLLIQADKRLQPFDLRSGELLPSVSTSEVVLATLHDPQRDIFHVGMRGSVLDQYVPDASGHLVRKSGLVDLGPRVFYIAVDPVDGTVLGADMEGQVRRWREQPVWQIGSPLTDEIACEGFEFWDEGDGQHWPEILVKVDEQLKRINLQSDTEVVIPCRAPFGKTINRIDDQHLVVSSGLELPMVRVNVNTGELKTLPIRSGGHVRVSSDGRWLLGGAGPSNYAWMLDMRNWRSAIQFAGHNARGITYLPSRNEVFWQDGNKLRCRPLDATAEVVRIDEYGMMPEHLHASPGEELLAVGQGSREVILLDTQSRQQHGPKLMHEGNLLQMRFTPDSRTLITITDDGTIRLWNVTTGRQMLQHRIPSPEGYWHGRISRNGQFIGLHNGSGLTLFRLY